MNDMIKKNEVHMGSTMLAGEQRCYIGRSIITFAHVKGSLSISLDTNIDNYHASFIVVRFVHLNLFEIRT